MPINFSCAKCQKTFTVADAAAGKQGRCKDCGHLNTIPELTAAAPARPAATSNVPATYEITSAVNGSVFGPADQKTLKQWVKEDRITPECQIKKVGTDNWAPAKKYFPQLNQDVPVQAAAVAPSAEVRSAAVEPKPDAFANFKAGGAGGNAAALHASTDANPYAAGTSVKKQINVSSDVVPTSGDIGFIIGHAFDAFKNNMGLMIGGTLLFFILSIMSAMLVQSFPIVLGEVGALIGGILHQLVSIYLGAGFLNFGLKVGRREPATIGDLFSVGDRVLPLLGYMLLSMIAIAVPLVILGVLAGFVAPALGGEGAVIVGVIAAAVITTLIAIIMLLLWPSYFLIVDRKTKVMKSFGIGAAIGRKNILQFIAIYFLSLLVFFGGFLLLGIGVIFSAPLAALIVCSAYLNMSGQIRP